MEVIKRCTLMLVCLLAPAAVQLLSAQNSSEYHLIREIRIGGRGGWDYVAVNPDLHRIYVSHDTLVNILDEITGDSIGLIPDTKGVHGIAFASPSGKGYTSNGRANTVTVFDMKTNGVKGEIRAGMNPDAIMYDEFSKTIITCNGRSHDVTVIDPAADTVVATVAVGGKPEAPVSDGAGNIFINIEDKNEVIRMDAKTWKVEDRWKLGKGEGPTGISLDRKTKRLFVGCEKLMVVLNAVNGSVIAEIPIGDRCDGTAFDPSSGTVFASCGDGTLSVVQEVSADSFVVKTNVPTKRGARTITIDPVTHHLFLPTAEYEPAPPATADNPRPRSRVKPGTFMVLEFGK